MNHLHEEEEEISQCETFSDDDPENWNESFSDALSGSYSGLFFRKILH